MALAKILKSIEDLSEDIKQHYTKRGDKYVLDIEGDDDTSALRNAKDREKERADAEAQRRREAEKYANELETKVSDLEANPEVTQLKTSLEEQTKKFEKLTGQLSNTARASEAQRIAAEISKAPKLLSKFIEERIGVELDQDFKTVVKPLGPDGKPAENFSFDDLKKEFAENKDFADIIIASKASGGGAPRGGSPGQTERGAFNNQQQQQNAPLLSQMSPQDLAAHMKAKKEAGA